MRRLDVPYEKWDVREHPDVWIVRSEFSVLAKLRETIEDAKKEILVAFPVIPEEKKIKIVAETIAATFWARPWPNMCISSAGFLDHDADSRRKAEIRTSLNISRACASSTRMLVTMYAASCRMTSTE